MQTTIRASGFFAIIAAAGGIALPSQLEAQRTSWITQLEGNIGWWMPVGHEVQATDAGGSATTLDFESSLAFGVQASFPIANWPRPPLGGLSVGVQGILVPGADLTGADNNSNLGKADYYQLEAIVGIGEFVGGTPITATLVPTLGVGVGRTELEPSPGVVLTNRELSTTSLVLSATVGIDFLLAPAVSVVTQTGANLGTRGSDAGTVTEWSFHFLGGVAIRLPWDGGPSQ